MPIYNRFWEPHLVSTRVACNNKLWWPCYYCVTWSQLLFGTLLDQSAVGRNIHNCTWATACDFAVHQHEHILHCFFLFQGAIETWLLLLLNFVGDPSQIYGLSHTYVNKWSQILISSTISIMSFDWMVKFLTMDFSFQP